MTESLAAAGLSALFFWGLRFLPLFGIVAVPAAALPLARLAGRRGLKFLAVPVVLVAALSAALAFSLAVPGAKASEALIEAAVYVGMIGASAVAVGVSRRGNPSHAFMGLVVYGAVVTAAGLAAVPGVPAQLSKGFDSIARSWTDSLRQSGAEADALRAWQDSADAAAKLAAAYAPGLITVFWIVVAAPSFYLGRRLAHLPGTFSDFRIPPLFAMLFVASGAAAVVFHGTARRAAADVLAPLLALYFLCGLSIITHFARRHLRLRVLRAALYLAVSVAPFSAVTAGLGLFDWYFDFRRRADREEKER